MSVYQLGSRLFTSDLKLTNSEYCIDRQASKIVISVNNIQGAALKNDLLPLKNVMSL